MGERRVVGERTAALSWTAAVAVWVVAATVACSQQRALPPGAAARSSERPSVQEAKALPMRRAEQAVGGAAPAAPAAAAVPTVASGLEAMAASRKLIRAGHLTIEVASYAEAQQRAVRLTEGLRGYLADSQSTRFEQGKLRGSLTLRVPAESFAVLLEGLRSLGTVQAENVSAQDVTKAYTDLETRLRVKRQTQERLQQILTTRTAKLSDVLEAERELARVTEEIETLEGERRFYDQQVALSTITAELAEPLPLVRAGFLDPIRSALAQSLELLGGSVAALLSLLVLALPWALLLAALYALVRRFRRRGAPRTSGASQADA